jgi:hypothetical protein
MMVRSVRVSDYRGWSDFFAAPPEMKLQAASSVMRGYRREKAKN